MASKLYFIVCSTGDLHEQEFQVGRAKYGAYHTRKDAERGKYEANQRYAGHRIITVDVDAKKGA